MSSYSSTSNSLPKIIPHFSCNSLHYICKILNFPFIAFPPAYSIINAIGKHSYKTLNFPFLFF